MRGTDPVSVLVIWVQCSSTSDHKPMEMEAITFQWDVSPLSGIGSILMPAMPGVV